MKKILFIVSVIALAIPLMVGTSFGVTIPAADNSEPIQSGSNPICTISLSKNVSFGYLPDSNANAQSYAIQSYHTSGHKTYGTASDTTLIYWQTNTTGDDIGEPSASDSSMFNTGWTPM